MEDARAIAKKLQELKPEILRCWEKDVREGLPAAGRESSSTLRDSLPTFIDDLARALSSDFGTDVREDIKNGGQEHGNERFRSSTFSIEDLVQEYVYLRKSIFSLLEREVPLTPRIRDLIYEGLELALSESLTEYALQRVEGKSVLDLKSSEIKYRQLFDLSPVGKSEIDLSTLNFVRANQKLCQMFGYEEKEFLTKHIDDITVKEDRLRGHEAIEALRAGSSETYRIEMRLLRSDGTPFWCEVNLTRISPGKQHGLCIAVVIDISDRKLAQTTMEESRKRLQLITDIQPSLIGQVDKDLRYTFVNKAYEEWFGIPLQEIVGHTVEDLIGPEGFQLVRNHFAAALRGEKVVFETQMEYRNQSRYVHATYSPGFDENGEVDSIYISVVDMSEQRRALESSKRSEQQFRNLADALPQLVWMSEPDGSITWFNERYYQFTGLTPAEALGWGWTQSHWGADSEERRRKYRKRVTAGEIWEDTFPIRGKDGQWRWFLTRATPLRDENGKINRWLGTNTDVTEQKATLDALREETILRDKFVSTLTHDLRTPLTAGKMAAEILRRKGLEEPVPTLSTRVIDSINRANKMIEDLLDASKIRAGGEFVLTMEHIDVVEVVEKALEELTTIHGDRFILSSPEKVEAWLSPSGIRRIVENLCTNAIKYGSPHDPVKIGVESGSKNLSICVRNQGHPLLQVDKERLFEPFRRGSTSETAGKQGWGIGLTVVKGITRAHDGEVFVDSNEGGTTFIIKLPVDARKEKDRDTFRGA